MENYLDRLAHLHKMGLSEIQELLFEMDDRSSVIMAISLLDDLIALAIIQKLKRNPTNPQAEELFSGAGPLSTFSAKVSLGYLLGILGPDMRHDISIMRRIRNEFAHTYTTLNFDSEKIKSRCQSLKLQTKLAEGLESRVKAGPKGRFIRSFIKIVVFIVYSAALAIEEKKVLQKLSTQLQEAAKATMTAEHKSAVERTQSSS